MNLDAIEDAIMMSVMEQKGIGFEALVTEVRNKMGKKRLSPTTINTRLRTMMGKGFVKKNKKRKYFPAFDVDAKSSLKELSNNVAELRRRTDKSIKSSNFLKKGVPLVHEIFYDWYVPNLNYKMVLGPMFSNAENYKLDYELKKCEKMIQDLTKKFRKEVIKNNL